MSTTRNSTTGVESLAEVFRCFICMEKLRDARLCPHCSKLCCYPCIRRWLTDQHQQCPHCRTTLRLQDLVNCRWAEEVTSQLDSLKVNETSQQKREEKDKCELHHEKLTVYCSSCSKCICHQCALFNSSHTGHCFLPLDDVYKTNMSIINEHLRQLKRRHVELICLTQDIERNVETLNRVKEERLREARNTMHAIQTKLEELFQIKFDALATQRGQFSRETDIIECALHDIEYRLSSNGKAEVISKQQDLLHFIQNICRKSIAHLSFTPISCDFPSELIPSYNSGALTITNFSLLQETTDPVYSQPLHANGLTWRLKVYPNGNGTVRGTYLSVFLELTHGLNEPSKYEYRIEMIYQLGSDVSKNMVREFASDFEVGECWGYNKFFLLNALRTDGFLDTNEDTLKLRFQVRSPTYQQKSRDQQWYIKQLENSNEQLHREIRNLQEKLCSLTPKPTLNKAVQSTTQACGEEMNNDDDDAYTSIESDPMDSDEEINILAEQNLHWYPSESAIIISNPVTTDSHTLSEDIDDEIENAFHAWKYESTPCVATENFILAHLLDQSTNEDTQHSNSAAFRSLTSESQPLSIGRKTD